MVAVRGRPVGLAVLGIVLATAGCGQDAEKKPQSSHQERVAEAIKTYEEASRQRPDDARVLSKLGRAYLIARRHSEAVTVLRKAVILEPDLASAHADLGTAYGFRAQWQPAIESFKEAIRLSPNMTDAHSRLGTTYLAVGDVEGALREYKWLNARAPTLAQELAENISTYKMQRADLPGERR
jgi:Flp pilus assembly protein TadD